MVVEILLLGAAYHEQPGLNNFNPGLGVQLQVYQEETLDRKGEFEILLGGARYRDSYSNDATILGATGRVTYGPRDGFNGGGDLLFGHGETTAHTGPIAIPSVFVGYQDLHVHAALMSSTLDAVGFYARYTVRF